MLLTSARRLLAILLLFLLGAAPLVSPTGAQPPTPTPVPTPTKTPSELIGINAPVDAATELLGRYGLWGLLGLLLLAAAFGIVSAAAKKAGEGIGDFLYRVLLGQRLDQRADALAQQRERSATAATERRALASGLDAYLDWIAEELRHLPIIPIKSSERQEQLLLEEVYVPLRVVERAQIEGFHKLTLGDFDPEGEYRLREEAFEALQSSQGVYRLLSDSDRLPQLQIPQRRQRARPIDQQEAPRELTTTRLLLVGDAGSGKTTTLQFGALALAHDRRRSDGDAARALLDLHCAQPLLPFFVRLTLVATFVREAQQRASADDLPALQGAPSALLLKWLDGYTRAQVSKKGHEIPADLPSQQIAAGGCLVLLDGLDEAGDAAERDYIQRLIANLAQDYPHNRYLVASRPFVDLRLPGFTERHLSPLDSDEMQLLLRNWFRAIYKTQSTRRADESAEEQVGYLWGLLEGNARLFEMATNPLLLTSMALLAHTGVGLPRERAELYNRLIDLLLDTWRIAQITGGLPGRSSGSSSRYGEEESAKSVQRRLQELAAAMQEQQRREIRLIEAQQALRPIYEQLKHWPAERCDDYIAGLLESLALESGLIQRRDGGYSFAHYTLQEYLTARAYDQRPGGVELLAAQWAQPRWRETILLAVGHWATSGDPDKARQLLDMLLASADPAALLLAGAALDDADAGRVPELASLRAATVERLHAAAFDPRACPDPRARNRAATLLDRLGADTRPALELDRPEYWAQRIEPGPFLMGDSDLSDAEGRAFVYAIRRSYALARFPVTNRQYALFLADLEQRGRDDEARQRRPRRWPGGRYRAGEGSYPVTAVSWEDATAFAAWADRFLRERGVLGAGEAVRLPTEPEWERAAAYPARMPPGDPGAGRREYPWGRWDDPQDAGGARGDALLSALLGADLTATTGGGINGDIRANTKESAIGSASVVGIFPHGAAGCGAEDMAGNVWEWCSTRFQEYPLSEEAPPETLDTYNRGRTYALRGGGWYDTRTNVRCAARNHIYPGSVTSGLRLARLFSSVES